MAEALFTVTPEMATGAAAEEKWIFAEVSVPFPLSIWIVFQKACVSA